MRARYALEEVPAWADAIPILSLAKLQLNGVRFLAHSVAGSSNGTITLIVRGCDTA
jgi:hypothetical protein